MIFGGCGALVFVIDAQDDYMESLAKLHETVTKAYKVGTLFSSTSSCLELKLINKPLSSGQVNPHIRFEVFIHKVDGLSDDHKIETTRDIHQRVSCERSC